MVTITNNPSISLTENDLVRDNSYHQNKTSQSYSSSPSYIESSQIDPDLLIKNYFSSSSEARYKSRKYIIEQIKDVKPFLAILSYGASGEYRDSYEGAINLLAETENYFLLNEVSISSRPLYDFLLQKHGINVADNFLEILIAAIACADKIDVNKRFNLLVNKIPKINSRMIKASMIDALGLIAGEIDLEIVKTEIEKFISDQDSYISNYAKEANKDLE